MRPLQPPGDQKFREVTLAVLLPCFAKFSAALLAFRLERDLQDQSTNSLIDPLGEPTLQLLSLVIMGRALPYLHNGIMVVDCDDDFAVRQREITQLQQACVPQYPL